MSNQEEAPSSHRGRRNQPAPAPGKSALTVAEYVKQQVSICPKTQRQIASEMNLDNPNVITLFKTGQTKVPVNRVPSLAAALGVDPVYLLSLVMNEYMPDTWDAISQLLGKTLVTQSELEILETVRASSRGLDVKPSTTLEKEELAQLVSKWAERENADLETIRRMRDVK